MKIDRHNYEEYFILYMDNELSSDERRGVETFVQQHPDLKEELDVFLQYKLTPDTAVTYTGKEELMKVNGDSPITFANYEEWLVLSIDNELNAEQKTAVNQFITDNPFVQQELVLLQRSKLQPEEIIFGNKDFLYRREEKVRTIPLRWWRVAAAVVILAIGLTTVIVLNNNPSGSKEDVAKIPSGEQKNTPVELPKQKNAENPVATTIKLNRDEPPVNTEKKKQGIAPVSKQSNTRVAVRNNNAVIENKTGNIPVPVKKDEPVIAENNNKPSNHLPQPFNTRINTTDVANKAIANTTKDVSNPGISLTNKDVTTNTTPSSDMVTASFNDEDAGKKGKLRGFFRKVTRTFEKRTNIDATDDDKLLVGGLAIKLK